MTGLLGLDWAILALSLTNTILLMWLGTTVLLNTERRTWGGWLAAAGLLMGGVFFVSHTAILGYGFNVLGVGIDLWWAVGLMAVTILPFLWYVMMLWYSGFWQKPEDGSTNELVRRHRLLLLVAGLLVIGLLLIALATRSFPISGTYPTRGLEESLALSGQPLVLVIYPVYVLVCLVFSLDALRKPGPTHRRMGILARKRARPWLVGATLALLFVSLGVGGVFAWLSQFVGEFSLIEDEIITIGIFDLVIQVLIAMAVVLLGQAVIAYEIFTGQTLPRQAFMRQWQRAILLAIGYGVVIGFTFSTNLRPIYGILLSALLMTFFFAMLSWRMVSERQRTIASLRPFVASQGFYDQLLAPSTTRGTDPGLQSSFNALCRNVLSTHYAILVAVGPLAPLVGLPLQYADDLDKLDDNPPSSDTLAMISQRLNPDISIQRVEEEDLPGIEWAVPLWGQRGLAGVFLLGEKRDKGIYSQEEIEVAQASGERLIDTKASAEIAQRLMSLQRQRLAETQVLDQRARRVLHDEVLQMLHTAMLSLDRANSAGDGKIEAALEMLTDVHTQISRLLRSMPGTSLPEVSKLGLITALRRLVDDEMGEAFDGVSWDVPHDVETSVDELTQLEAEVIYYAAREAIRNAARHGRPEKSMEPLHLTIRILPENRLTIVIEDDGVGLTPTKDEMVNGGQGLTLHSTMMAVIGGELFLESEARNFTRLILRLP